MLPPGRWKLALAGMSVVVVHGWLVLQFLSYETLFQTAPMVGDDFDTHIGQAYRLLRALDEAGRHWAYHVELLAGFPGGVIFDADNKGWSYFTFALWKGLGMAPGAGFNAFVWCAMLLPPLVLYVAARLFGFESQVALVAAAASSLFWFFDSFVHWSWWVGMVAYAFAAYFALLPLGMFHRFLETARVGWAAGCALLLSLSLLIHPYTFFILVAPMGTIYLRRGRALPWRVHGLTLAIVVAAILSNSFWLFPSLAQFSWILDSGYYAQGGLGFLLADISNLVISPTDTGLIGTRASFRFLYVALAAAGIVHMWRAGDQRCWVFAAGVGALFALAYLGAYVPFASQIQPYRHVAPLGFMAALPAASMACAVARARPLSGLRGEMRVLVLVALAGCGLRLWDDVVYFAPHLQPRVAPLIDGAPAPITATGGGPVGLYRLPHDRALQGGVDRLVAWAAQQIGRGGRVLVEEPVLGERLAWRAGLEVIGGFRLRNLEHSKANMFRTRAGRPVTAAWLRPYLETFAIQYIIARREHRELDQLEGLLERVGGQEGLFGRRVYRVRAPGGKVLAGPGRVRARMNRLTVRGSDPAREVVLSYHHHPQLVCRPDCRVERAPIAYDQVGLVRVPAPHPAGFTISLAY